MKLRIILILFLPVFLMAEERVWIFFKDKGPRLTKNRLEAAQSHLSERAVDRRFQRTDAPYFDFTDLPLYDEYINTIQRMNIKIHTRSKWLNAVSVYLEKENRQILRDLPFIKSVSDVKVHRFKKDKSKTVSFLPKPERSDYGPSDNQNRMIGIPAAHTLGFNGEGVRIALFDTGFILEHEALQHLKVIATRDFVQGDEIVSNQEEDSPSQHNHGTLVLSVIGGYRPGFLIGPAYAAEYLLAKTENISSETKVEEDNWVAAAEWADSLGADIISTSLGYSIFDLGEASYSYADMDGNTAIITRAADLAVKKGILVFASAGNEGNSSWYYITAPADGDSVIAMGAVHPDGSLVSFSSRGPTSDGQIKPDLMAQGRGVFCAAPNTIDQYTGASGTSLSSPLGAGAAALLLSINPQLKPMTIREILISTASRAQNPDNNYGYGIIDLEKALTGLQNEPVARISTFLVTPRTGKNIIQWVTLAEVKVEEWVVRRYGEGSAEEVVGRVAGQDFNLRSQIYTLADVDLSGGEEYTYSLYARFDNGTEIILDSEQILSQSASSISLLQGFPNPFNNSTRITFSLDYAASVSLTIFDAGGRLVRSLIRNEYRDAQFHHVEWNGQTDAGISVSSGIYYAVLSALSQKQTIKLVLIR